jgi:hypothetical protein
MYVAFLHRRYKFMEFIPDIILYSNAKARLKKAVFDMAVDKY